MQDTHWAGLYGYFPSYALGNIYDGQINASLSKAVPEWHSQLSQGQLDELNNWLRQNIHSKGNLYDPEELIKLITGTTLDSAPFLTYLNEKYSGLYGF